MPCSPRGCRASLAALPGTRGRYGFETCVPMPGLMFYPFNILNNFLTRVPHFHFSLGAANYIAGPHSPVIHRVSLNYYPNLWEPQFPPL